MAQTKLSKQQNGDFFSINWGFGIAVMLGAYVSGGISGGHLNPAVTLALAISKKFEWKRLPVYFAGQYLGAFLAAAIVYAVYYGKYYVLVHCGKNEKLTEKLKNTHYLEVFLKAGHFLPILK